MAKRAIREDHISHERWMVSYADFMTLLLAFFVVMYSVSQLNVDKFRVLTQTLEKAFNVPESSLKPIQVGTPVTAVQPGTVEDSVESPEQMPKSGHIEEEAVKATTSEPQLPEEFKRISQQVEQQFADLVAKGLVSVQGNEEWLEIELKSSLLFASGDAIPGNDAIPIMDALAAVVRDSELPIRVEGFTDDRPIRSDVFPSNWELSSARAASIVKLLMENGVDARRLAAIGYGEFQPVDTNATEPGRAANRRVVLMISRNAHLRPELQRGQVAPTPVEQIVRSSAQASASAQTPPATPAQVPPTTAAPDTAPPGTTAPVAPSGAAPADRAQTPGQGAPLPAPRPR